MLKRKLVGCIALLILAATTTSIRAQTPSFDCARAAAPDEHAICSNAQLADFDRLIADGYRQLKDRVGTTMANRITCHFCGRVAPAAPMCFASSKDRPRRFQCLRRCGHSAHDADLVETRVHRPTRRLSECSPSAIARPRPSRTSATACARRTTATFASQAPVAPA